MLSRKGGFLEPIDHFERRRTFISMTKGIELDKLNPPLQKNGYLSIEPLRAMRYPRALSARG